MSDVVSSETEMIPATESSSPVAKDDNTSQQNASVSLTPESSSTPVPTVGQLMRSVSQAMQQLYRDRLGHKVSKITCHLVDSKLLIWVENSVTRPEQMLLDSNSAQLPALSLSIKAGLKASTVEVVERCLKVEVLALLSDTSYEQSCTAMVALLSNPPQVRASKL